MFIYKRGGYVRMYCKFLHFLNLTLLTINIINDSSPLMVRRKKKKAPDCTGHEEEGGRMDEKVGVK